MFKFKIQNTLKVDPSVLRFEFLVLNLFGVSDLGFRFSVRHGGRFLWYIRRHMTEKPSSTPDTAGWFGHPRGLSTLFFTEMWERFSYYGMRAFLILYMTAPVVAGGLGFDVKHAGSIYGLYTGSVWMAAIGGGLLADWFLGQYRSVLVGGLLITMGHFTLAFPALPFFYAGLILIVIGTGLLKPNVSTIVGSLYDAEDARRDAGFSIFYMGINLGAAIGPFVAGWLAQGEQFKAFLTSVGLDPINSWHWGFACAGVGMTFGLIQYVRGRGRLQIAIERIAARPKAAAAGASPGTASLGFTAAEWKRLAAVVVFFIFASIFWSVYEQAGSTLNLFADSYTRLSVFGFTFPSSFFQSVPAIFVICLAPIFAWLWVRLGSNEPSSPAKFAFGLLFVGLSFLLLVPGSTIAQSADGVRVSPLWLVGVYFLQVCGEMSLSPVGLSLVTKLAPQRIVGLMMGVWFLSISMGSIIGGKLAGLFKTYPLPQLFGVVAVTAVAASLLLFLLIKPIRKLMGGVH
jgi:POT family proton-dependent oligopeptide transporter